MSLEPYIVELDWETKTTLKIYLYKNVANIETIRNNVTKGVWKCVVIKPSLILHPFQVAVAANRAVVAEKFNTMITRTVFAEILYNLSLTKNISQSLSKFGVENDNNILACFLVQDGHDDSGDILPLIEGEECPITDLNKYTNIKEVKSVYKLNNFNDTDDLLDIIVSRIVSKNFVSY